MTASEAKRRARLEADARRLGVAPITLEMSEAVPTKLIQDLVKDFRSPTQPSSMIETPKAEPRVVKANETPIGPPPGISIIDQMCDDADRKERIQNMANTLDLARKLRQG